ncbi:hypothetical protein [Coleopteran arli-related virus OKIAV107]|uniref:C3H1-type domain-containing protein n=1 Tax=Coleopteran arli-related virus OKIAV107 TaxID=2746353 RepID=A0AAE7LSR3_9MONO|nr:hypothetical protein QKS55_gp2 [Coleopteran arli-related virus OKIAV107]QMP82313.1 hypothetical protein [Coleopteran arli-related virus OKIAV107]
MAEARPAPSVTSIRQDLASNFPYEKIISSKLGEYVEIPFIGQDGTEKILKFCYEFSTRSACVYGSNCRYSHGYEYTFNSGLSIQSDIIISKMNTILKNQDFIIRTLKNIPCSDPKKHDSTYYREKKTSRVMDDKIKAGPSTDAGPRRSEKRSGKKPYAQRSRSTSMTRSVRGASSQDERLMARLTRFKLKDDSPHDSWDS